jgi:hypothetical protein
MMAAFVHLAASASAARGAEPMVGGTRYRLTIDNEWKDSPSPTRSVTHWGMVAYDFRADRKGDRVEIAIDRVTHANSRNGEAMSRSETTRSGEVRQAHGQIVTTDRSGAKPEQVAFFDQMEAPLAVLTLDAEGGELGREMKAIPAFTAEYVDILRTFSPRFPRDKAEWDVKPDLLPQAGRKSEGTLHYRKRPAAKPGGPIEVEVSGKMILTGKHGRDDIKTGHDEVKGVQTYDPGLGEWVAGKLTIARVMEMVTPAGEAQTMRITTVMTLSRQEEAPEKAKGSP